MAEVRLEVGLPYPRERVWRALTEAQLLSEWLMPTDLAASEGARFTLEPGTLPGFLGQVSGEVTELTAPDRIVMRWQGEKLHTRVVWELAESGAGCTLRVVQTGFIGAPATLRRRALRDTYSRLFAERLPGVLDRLAAVPADEPAGTAASGGGAAVRTAVRTAAIPRQRKAPVNMPVGAWTGGRQLGGRAARAPAGLARDRRGLRSVPAWLERLGAGPAWARAVVIGAVAAAIAVLVLAAVVYTPGSGADPGGDPGTGRVGEQAGPGVALQPGDVTSHTSEPEPSGPGGAGQVSDAPASQERSGQDAASGPGIPASGGPPEATTPPDPTAGPAPALTAQLATSDRLLLGLGGLAVTVTVANPGPGNVAGWEVAVDVGDQEVANVVGADYARDGSQAIFTPADAELAAGASTQFSFDLPGVLVSEPSGCTIDGSPCG